MRRHSHSCSCAAGGRRRVTRKTRRPDRPCGNKNPERPRSRSGVRSGFFLGTPRRPAAGVATTPAAARTRRNTGDPPPTPGVGSPEPGKRARRGGKPPVCHGGNPGDSGAAFPHRGTALPHRFPLHLRLAALWHAWAFPSHPSFPRPPPGGGCQPPLSATGHCLPLR